jgi:hypothetical protein
VTRKSSANLAPVPDDPGRTPPVPLRPPGLALWRAVTASYAFDDAGSFHVLAMACQCLDRAERCREMIDHHGELLFDRNGVGKSNPLLRDEVQNRALSARLLGKLGLDLEPIRPNQGRPPGYSPQLAGKVR